MNTHHSDEHVSHDEFRATMRKLAGAVIVITTEYEDRLHGMTATAISSVCADPPTILIVVNRSTRSHPMISKSGSFVVNILSQEQRDIAQLFAGKSEDKFAEIGFGFGKKGAPIISGSGAHLDCEVVVEMTYRTHTIFLARVLGSGSADNAPLIYHDGSYKTLVDCAPAQAAT
jgi:flavin reductase (DIM6/NTAB) family NADH-FMN oxidoreductase RutF